MHRETQISSQNGKGTSTHKKLSKTQALSGTREGWSAEQKANRYTQNPCGNIDLGIVRQALGQHFRSHGNEPTAKAQPVNAKKTVTIEVWRGLIRDLGNLPREYDYENVDHNLTEEGDVAICGWQA